jgi:SAM-dependent methyltransferase
MRKYRLLVTPPAVTAGQLPFGDAVFDLVVATLSVSHWSDKAAGLAEISRVMTPDATLVVADVYSSWLSAVRSGRPGAASPGRVTSCRPWSPPRAFMSSTLSRSGASPASPMPSWSRPRRPAAPDGARPATAARSGTRPGP